MTISKPITTLRAIAFAWLILILGACQRPLTTLEKIDRLKKQVETDVTALQRIEEQDYPKLSKTFMQCDSLLQFMDAQQVEQHFQTLNLTNAYLQQFETLRSEMHDKLDYSRLQIGYLHDDVSTHKLSDSLALAYLNTETQVADTLHHRIAYFRDRFAQCQKELAQLKKARR